jgi:hypothetical protein
MKSRLLFADRDLDAQATEPKHSDEVVADLELDTLLDAMAGADKLIWSVSRLILLNGLTDVDQINYRQQVLADCLQHPEDVRALYALAGDGIEAERSVWRGFLSERPESLLHRSVQIMDLFVEVLRKLRALSAEVAPRFQSTGFTRFFALIIAELDEDYFAEIERHLKNLRFSRGTLISARLGRSNEGVEFVLRRPKDENRSMFNRAGLRKPTFSYTIPDRDEAGMHALAELHDRALDDVANAAAQSCDHVLSFFRALRVELAFYLGCLNLHERLDAIGAAANLPEPRSHTTRAWSAVELYDVCLCLRVGQPVVANTVNADGARLIMVTGANQGGKSTFLRSVGLAQLMMDAGMFVGAREFAAATRTGVFTHYKREEDVQMESGKFDEELKRMSTLAEHIRPGALLLCNESFQATNEREGSEIGRHVLTALLDAGITVFFVTHLYDLAHSCYAERSATSLFLRAERGVDGRRTFRVVPGEPQPTSHGLDLYDRIFASA